jgi:hypothetical protein
MSGSYSFIKYVYVSILFIFVFVALFSQHMQSIGYGSLFGLQTIYTIILFFDIFTNKTRNDSALETTIPATTYSDSYKIELPYWCVLVPCMLMQFASSMLMLMTWNYLSSRTDNVQLSRSNETRMANYKVITVFTTLLLLCLTYMYVLGGKSTVEGTYQLAATFVVVCVTLLCILNMIYANELSKLRFTSTDG